MEMVEQSTKMESVFIFLSYKYNKIVYVPKVTKEDIRQHLLKPDLLNIGGSRQHCGLASKNCQRQHSRDLFTAVDLPGSPRTPGWKEPSDPRSAGLTPTKTKQRNGSNGAQAMQDLRQ